MSRPFLHVHMPVYNTSPEVLREAVDAVHADMEASDVDDYMVKLLDDGSTNHATVSEIELVSRHPHIDAMRIEHNLGIGACRSILLAQSIEEGVFAVANRDSDDVTIAASARTELDMLDSGYGMVGGAMYIREIDGRERLRIPHTDPRDILTDIRRGLIPCFNPTVMYRTDIVPAGVTYPNTRFGEDIFFQATLLANEVRLGNTEQVVTLYRRNENTLTHNFGNGFSSMVKSIRGVQRLWRVDECLKPELPDRAFAYLRSGAKLLPRKSHYFLSRVLYGNR